MSIETVKDIEVCTAEHLGIKFTPHDANSKEAQAEADGLHKAINDYLKVFAAPIEREKGSSIMGNRKCLRCETVLDGFLGSFQWGIVHGEGHCSSCGYPVRAYHCPKDGEREIFNRPLESILQYHPDCVSKAESSQADLGDTDIGG